MGMFLVFFFIFGLAEFFFEHGTCLGSRPPNPPSSLYSKIPTSPSSLGEQHALWEAAVGEKPHIFYLQAGSQVAGMAGWPSVPKVVDFKTSVWFQRL